MSRLQELIILTKRMYLLISLALGATAPMAVVPENVSAKVRMTRRFHLLRDSKVHGQRSGTCGVSVFS